MQASHCLVLIFLAQQIGEARYQQKVMKSLQDSGCAFVCRETPLSLVLGPAFRRVEGARISGDKLRQPLERVLRQLPVFGGLKSLSIDGMVVEDLADLERLGSLDSLALTNVGLDEVSSCT
jgi:hypothetical protein